VHKGTDVPNASSQGWDHAGAKNNGFNQNFRFQFSPCRKSTPVRLYFQGPVEFSVLGADRGHGTGSFVHAENSEALFRPVPRTLPLPLPFSSGRKVDVIVSSLTRMAKIAYLIGFGTKNAHPAPYPSQTLGLWMGRRRFQLQSSKVSEQLGLNFFAFKKSE